MAESRKSVFSPHHAKSHLEMQLLLQTLDEGVSFAVKSLIKRFDELEKETRRQNSALGVVDSFIAERSKYLDSVVGSDQDSKRDDALAARHKDAAQAHADARAELRDRLRNLHDSDQ